MRKHNHNSKGFKGPGARNPAPALHLAPEAGAPSAAAELSEFASRKIVAFPPSVRSNPARVFAWGLSKSGRRSTEARLTRFASLFNQTLDSFPWAETTAAHVVMARALLRETGASASSVNMTLSAVRSVARTCRRLGLPQMSAVVCAEICEVEGVRGSGLPAGRALPQAEIDALFLACARDRTTAGARDLALLSVLYYGGLRRDEACGLRPEDFRRRDRTLLVLGKNEKEALVYLEAKAARLALSAWARRRGDRAAGPLFCSLRRGGALRLDVEGRAKALTGDSVYKIVGRRAAAAGVSPCSPHDLRRSAITNLLESGADPLAVKDWARHENVSTTTIYDRRRERAARTCARRLAPSPGTPRSRRKPHKPKRGRTRLPAPLTAMRKDLLLTLARAHGLEVPEGATRGELAELIRERTAPDAEGGD